jgi:polar amino acid transport system substrate-binding protein
MLKTLARMALAGALTVGASVPAWADVFSDVLSRGTIRVAVFADVPPFGSQNANRELEGFDIDLAKLVAEALNVKLELVQSTAANRIPYLMTDKADINVAAMSITPERAKQVMYSAPYANTYLAVFGPKATEVKSAADVTKLKTSVAKGTTEDLLLTAANPDADIMRTEDNATAVQAYLSGQSDLLAANSVVVVELAKKNPNKEFDLKFTLRRAPAHITVKIGEHNMLKWLDTFLFLKQMDGTLDQLHRKWLGLAMEPLPTL